MTRKLAPWIFKFPWIQRGYSYEGSQGSGAPGCAGQRRRPAASPSVSLSLSLIPLSLSLTLLPAVDSLEQLRVSVQLSVHPSLAHSPSSLIPLTHSHPPLPPSVDSLEVIRPAVSPSFVEVGVNAIGGSLVPIDQSGGAGPPLGGTAPPPRPPRPASAGPPGRGLLAKARPDPDWD